MKLAVTDANIFIDLIKIDCLHYLFQLKISLHTTAEVLAELYDEQQAEIRKYIKSKQLKLDWGLNYQKDFMDKLGNALAPADKSVFYYALHLKSGILTGDYLLREKAGKYFEVHGILWLLDKFVDAEFLTGNEVCKKLDILILYKCRLPKKECEKLMKKWKGK